MPLKTYSHVSFRHPDINILKVAAKPARSRARPSRGVEQRESGKTSITQSLLGEAHFSRGAPSARAWLSLAESRSWEPPVAACVAAMNGQAEHGRAQSAVGAGARYGLSLCSSSHCCTEDGGGGASDVFLDLMKPT